MANADARIDVLCVGHACYDLVFAVDHHLAADEKATARAFTSCGGGPTANAAVTVARLGLTAAFAGYLGGDEFGRRHLEEFTAAGVDCAHVVRGGDPTPLSVALVKPTGERTLVNYRTRSAYLNAESLAPDACRPAVVLMDGHEPELSDRLAGAWRRQGAELVLDAGSLHAGTRRLLDRVDLLAASETFARQFTGARSAADALATLAGHAPAVIVTQGERGLVWRRGGAAGRLEAYAVAALDTTGAGDVFHGALAAGLAQGLPWPELLAYASAAAALCCTRHGARHGIPTAAQVRALMHRQSPAAHCL